MYKINFNKPTSIHFIGIGGCSMSGLAGFCIDRGFKVSGSDRAKSASTERLAELGAQIFIGQRESNVDHDPEIVVFTEAIPADNPEFGACVNKGLNMLRRSEFLGQLMLLYKDAVSVAGTHGKTSTTSLLSFMLLEAGMDPTVALGGQTAFCDSIRIGSGGHLVMEACEYKNQFLNFNPVHAIFTNIEAEHLDFFKDLNDIRNSFRIFAEKLPENGILIVNNSISDYRTLFGSCRGKVFSYGLQSEDSDSGRSPEASDFLNGEFPDFYGASVSFDEHGNGSYDFYGHGKKVGRVSLAIPGRHTVENSVAATAMALLLGVPFNAVCRAASSFGGAAKRFEFKGSVGGVNIIDDYAHHPSEIKATLKTAQKYPHKTIWTVFQPHTYSRTKLLFNDFVEALSLSDKVILADIYAAREKDPGDISSKDLCEALKTKGVDAFYFPCFGDIENFLLEKCEKNDLLITMGAGDVVKIGESLLGK